MLSKETLHELVTYLDQLDKDYEKILDRKLTREERILTDVLTVNEEWGEFNDEIKRDLGLAFNKEKSNNAKREDLEDELVDVLIPLYLLTKSLGIENLDDAIKRKVLKNNKRGY